MPTIRIWLTIRNGGDGSVYTQAWPSEAEAEEYMEGDDERLENDVTYEDIDTEDYEVIG